MLKKRLLYTHKPAKRLILAVVIAVCIAGAFFGKDAMYRQLDSWKLIPRPERLTELFFTEHTKLPTSYRQDESMVVDFTVHNLEYRTTKYHYTIVESSEDGTQSAQLAAGDTTLKHDESHVIPNTLTYVDMGPRARVRVTLSYDGIKFGEDEPSAQSQSIHYWMKHIEPVTQEEQP